MSNQSLQLTARPRRARGTFGQMYEMKTAVLFFMVSCMTVCAEFAPLAPKVTPLPDDQVGVLFDKINKGENIDLPTLYQALNGSQTTLRAYAARELGKYGDRSSVPYLIDALSDESMHVGARYIEAGMATTRYWANDSLKKLTGKDFGFTWDDSIENRSAAITKWREWFTTGTMTDYLDATDVLKSDGVLLISDGSSYYAFKTDGSFRSFPRGMSGRSFEGTWKKTDDDPVKLEVTARMGWVNGIQPQDEYRRIVFFVSGGGKRAVERSDFGASGYKEIFQGYFIIDELTKIPKPDK